MKRLILFILAVTLGVLPVVGQEYTWRTDSMDGSRTGCFSPSKDNVAQALGIFRKGKYIAPNGKVYKRNSSAAKTARAVLDAQPAMARVKDAIAYSTRVMEKDYPESELSNWFVDILMAKTQQLAERPVHMGIANFGGIRVDMPGGEVILDDLLSMFPFRNTVVYVEHTGKEIRRILEHMAAGHFEALGGVRVVAEGGKLVSAEIAGQPLDDEKVYGVATISFLLTGGDGLSLASNALSVIEFHDVQIIDAILEHVLAETAAGRPIEYHTDGRVVIKDKEEK